MSEINNIDLFKNDVRFRENIAHIETIPAKKASFKKVDDLSKKMSGCLKMEEITKENLTELIEFEPNFIEYDADENKFTIVNAKKFENHQIELIKKQTEEINSKKDMVNEISNNDETDNRQKPKEKARGRNRRNR